MLQARARLLVTVGLLLWAQAFTPPGHAATLATVNPFARNDPSQLFFTPECNVELHDRIYAGEAEEMAAKLKAFLPTIEAAAGQPAQGRFLALCLNSLGGDLREAVRIGQIFKGWMMVVPADSECLSACAVLFMSAAPRDRVFSFSPESPGRFLHHRGVLGFHVPDLSYPLDKATERLARAQSLGREQLPGQAKELVEEVKGIYLRSYERMREVAFPGHINASQSASTSWFLGTGLRINAMPPELLLAFLTTPHEKMFTVSTLIEAMGWGIEIYGIEPPRVLSEGLLKFACINVAAVRCLFTPEGECYDSFRAMQGGKVLAGIMQSQTNIDLAFKAQALMISTVPGAAEYLVPRYKTGWRELPPVKPEDIVRLIAFGLTEAPPLLGRSELYYLMQAQAEAVMQEQAEAVCEIRAAWDDNNRLADLHIDLIAQKHARRRALLNFSSKPELFALDLNRMRLRPWKLLPALTPLRDAGKGFEQLNIGGNFFSKPPNW